MGMMRNDETPVDESDKLGSSTGDTLGYVRQAGLCFAELRTSEDSFIST
jgi:hypothetical protein